MLATTLSEHEAVAVLIYVLKCSNFARTRFEQISAGGEQGGMSGRPGCNLNGRYVSDNAAITYRSGAALEVHKLNIKAGGMQKERGGGGKLRSRPCIQMSALIPLRPFRPSDVSNINALVPVYGDGGRSIFRTKSCVARQSSTSVYANHITLGPAPP